MPKTSKKISLIHQFPYEKKINAQYSWLLVIVALGFFTLYGLIFHNLNSKLRNRKFNDNNNKTLNRVFLKLNKCLDLLNSCIEIKNPPFFLNFFSKDKTIIAQPSIIIFSTIYLLINWILMLLEVERITYEPWSYILSKRIGHIACANYLILYIFIMKNDPIGKLTGLAQDKLQLIHIWLGRYVWLLCGIHFFLSLKYWLDIHMLIMIQIPPQYFGYIAYGSMTIVVWAGTGIIRKWSYECFLFHHKFFAMITVLLATLHAPGGRPLLITAFSVIFLDHITGDIKIIIHKYYSPTRGLSKCHIIDDTTIEVNIPLSQMIISQKLENWNFLNKMGSFGKFWKKHLPRFIPSIGTWKAGQHVYLCIGKVRRLQWHPMTIASVSETGVMHLLIKTRKGFTRRLAMEIVKQARLESEDDIICTNKFTTHFTSLIHGPYGGEYLPLLSFDTALFISGGSGGSFCFPVCIDLLLKIKQRNEECDFLGRPRQVKVKFVWIIQHLENINWYTEELLQMVELRNECKLEICLHVTRETKNNETDVRYEPECSIERGSAYNKSFSDILINKSIDESQEENCKLETTNNISNSTPLLSDVSLTNNAPEATEEDIFASSSHSTTTDYTINTDIESESPTFKYHVSDELESLSKLHSLIEDGIIEIKYCRPSSSGIIQEECDFLKCSNLEKSMSVLSCGPEQLTNSVTMACQKCRWENSNPDIYCYCEKYE